MIFIIQLNGTVLDEFYANSKKIKLFLYENVNNLKHLEMYITKNKLVFYEYFLCNFHGLNSRNSIQL